MLSNYTSRDEQLAFLDFVCLQDIDSKPREIRIRETANEVREGKQVYEYGGTYVIIKHPRDAARYRYDDDPLPLPFCGYTQIHVQLIPELQGYPDIAQVLLERQLAVSWP